MSDDQNGWFRLSAADLSVVDGGKDCIYLSGNSLGLQPKMVQKYLEEELNNWARMCVTYKQFLQILTAVLFTFEYSLCTLYNRGVHGHTEGSRPWAWAENTIEELMANLVGETIDSCLYFSLC